MHWSTSAVKQWILIDFDHQTHRKIGISPSKKLEWIMTHWDLIIKHDDFLHENTVI